MTDLVKIDGEKFLFRELHSKALLSTDQNDISKYNRQRNMMEKNNILSQDVDILKQKMGIIESLLLELLEKKS